MDKKDVIKPKPKGCWRIGFVIIAVGSAVIILFGIYSVVSFGSIMWPSFLSWGAKTPAPNSSISPSTSAKATPTPKGSIDVIDGRILGEWDTGCLATASTIEGRDTYYEKHTYVFRSNMTSNHKRYIGASCAAMSERNSDDKTWKIPLTGKIDFYMNGTDAGKDIYQISEGSPDTLQMGEGFRDRNPYGGVDGDGRMSSLNTFLTYKRVGAKVVE